MNTSLPLNEDTDARCWANEFCQIVKEKTGGVTLIDNGWMISWFANAIMCGHDACRRKYKFELETKFMERTDHELLLEADGHITSLMAELDQRIHSGECYCDLCETYRAAERFSDKIPPKTPKSK